MVNGKLQEWLVYTNLGTLRRLLIIHQHSVGTMISRSILICLSTKNSYFKSCALLFPSQIIFFKPMRNGFARKPIPFFNSSYFFTMSDQLKRMASMTVLFPEPFGPAKTLRRNWEFELLFCFIKQQIKPEAEISAQRGHL
jgi:hypothetical protein